MVAFRMNALAAAVGSCDGDSIHFLGNDQAVKEQDDQPQERSSSKKPFSKKWHFLCARRAMLMTKHRLLLNNDDDDYQDTTALLSEDEHSMMHNSSGGGSSTSSAPQPHAIMEQQEDKQFDIVWPESMMMMNSQEHHNQQHNKRKRISLQQIKSRMGKSLERVRSMRLRRQGFVDARDDADDEEEVSFVDSSDHVGLYAYPNDAVEAVMRDHNQKSSAWDNTLCHTAFSNDLTEVDPAGDPAMLVTPTRKQSFVVSYDEWDCAQLILQDEASNDGDDEEEIDENSLFLHLPSSKDGEGVEVPYNSAFFNGYLNGDDESSDDEELFLNPPPNQGFEVITRPDQHGRAIVPFDEDPDLEIPSSASSISDVMPRKKKLQPLGATFSHPSARTTPSRHPGQIYIQRSSSSEQPLGISSGHPSWNSKHRHGGTSSAVEEASDVWSKIHSPELDGNVTDPPSPTKIQTCETDWSQGLGWSATVDDDSDNESDLTVSDVGFTENLDCIYSAPTPIAAFTMKPRVEGGPLSRSRNNNDEEEECPSDENDDPSNRRSSMFGCSPDVMEELLRNTFYHVPEQNERPQCNCIKCSVQGMYRNLNGGI